MQNAANYIVNALLETIDLAPIEAEATKIADIVEKITNWNIDVATPEGHSGEFYSTPAYSYIRQIDTINAKLAEFKVAINPHLTAAGCYYPTDDSIEISDDVLNSRKIFYTTLIHELVHREQARRGAKPRAKQRLNTGQYFNDPQEIGAYAAQAAAGFRSKQIRQLRQRGGHGYANPDLYSGTKAFNLAKARKRYAKNLYQFLSAKGKI